MVMSVAVAEKRAIGPPLTCARVICGSVMPSGSCERIWSTAWRTSLTARSTGVSSVNCTKVSDCPSSMVESISSTPSRLRTAASTFCVT